MPNESPSIAVVATVADPKANSYITLETALDELQNFPDILETMTVQEIAQNVILSASNIDSLRYLGTKLYSTQSRAFPRKGDCVVRQKSYSGFYFLETTKVKMSLPTERPLTLYEVSLPVVPRYAPATITLTTSGGGIQHPANLDLIWGVTPDVVSYKADTLTITLDGNVAPDLEIEVEYLSTGSFKFRSAVFDPLKTLPNHLAGGSVHVVYADGTRSYHDVIEHNIVTGDVTCTGIIKNLGILDCILHPPVFDSLIVAQKLQLFKRLELLEFDPFIGSGVLKIKIDDTERQYRSKLENSARIYDLASRHNVLPQVVSTVGYLTVYGKLAALPQEELNELQGILRSTQQYG